MKSSYDKNVTRHTFNVGTCNAVGSIHKIFLIVKLDIKAIVYNDMTAVRSNIYTDFK